MSVPNRYCACAIYNMCNNIYIAWNEGRSGWKCYLCLLKWTLQWTIIILPGSSITSDDQFQSTVRLCNVCNSHEMKINSWENFILNYTSHLVKKDNSYCWRELPNETSKWSFFIEYIIVIQIINSNWFTPLKHICNTVSFAGFQKVKHSVFKLPSRVSLKIEDRDVQTSNCKVIAKDTERTTVHGAATESSFFFL